MTLYLDTSVLVKLYIREDDSEEVAAAVADATVVATSLLAYPEACAAFERRRREKSVSPAAMKVAKRAFEADWPSWIAVGIDDDLARQSARLAERHGLRAADAIHLASFERILAAAEDDVVQFLCADDRLSKAARTIGWSGDFVPGPLTRSLARLASSNKPRRQGVLRSRDSRPDRPLVCLIRGLRPRGLRDTFRATRC